MVRVQRRDGTQMQGNRLIRSNVVSYSVALLLNGPDHCASHRETGVNNGYGLPEG